MENNYFESLKFKYSKETGKISSVKVVFSDQTDDSVTISSDYISVLENYKKISETDKEIFFIIARAIQLKAENSRGSSSGKVRKYNFGSKYEPFSERFISKLMSLSELTPLDQIANYFGDEAKVADLDFFLNKKDVFQLSLYFRNELDSDETDDDDVDDDFYWFKKSWLFKSAFPFIC